MSPFRPVLGTPSIHETPETCSCHTAGSRNSYSDVHRRHASATSTTTDTPGIIQEGNGIPGELVLSS